MNPLSSETKPASATEIGDNRDGRASGPVLTPRRWVGYLLLVATIVALFTAGSLYFRRRVDAAQYQRKRYAVVRAMKALDADNKDLARQEVELLMTEVPLYKGGWFNQTISELWEGPVLRNQVSILEKLTARLLDIDMPEQAEAVAWKAQLEFHIPSRALELIEMWELLYHVKGVRQSWASAFEISRILAAHGVDHIRQPGQIMPVPYRVNPELFKGLPANLPPTLAQGLFQYYTADKPQDYMTAANTLRQARKVTKSPIIRHALDNTLHNTLIAAGQRVEARKLLGEVWGRDPALLDSYWRDPQNKTSMNLLDRDPLLLGMLWRDRPATSTLPIARFLESFDGDSRLRVLNFKGLKTKQIGYFNANNRVSRSGDSTILSQGVAASMQVQVVQPVYRLWLAYEATPALGIYPILLLRVNDEPYIPVYCDSATPGFVAIDFEEPLQPATYNLELVYLNDAGFSFEAKGITENRDLTLYRMALVHVPPAE